MKPINEIMTDIEHIPKCPKSGETNLLSIIKANNYGKNKDDKT